MGRSLGCGLGRPSYRVGEVTDLRLTDNPGQVAAMLAVNQATPVRADTRVTLEYAGLTGIASVSLKGGLRIGSVVANESGGTSNLEGGFERRSGYVAGRPRNIEQGRCSHR
jgi:hypothetical protein